MKRILGLLTVALVFTTISFAQVGFGIKGGANFATLGGADVNQYIKSRTGFVVGGYVTVGLPFLFTIQPEVLYSSKGYIFQPANTKSTLSLLYFEIPVLIKYSLPVPMLNPSVYVGPEVGMLLSAKDKLEPAGQPSIDSNVKSSFTTTDFGIAFGACAHLFVADFDVRYTMGLKTVDKTSQTKMYNRVWSIMVQFPMF